MTDLLGMHAEARRIAEVAHAGQEYAGRPYFDWHLLSVERRVEHLGFKVRSIALLHDVVEDTEVTVDDLTVNPHLPYDVVDAVEALTRRETETYRHYIGRLVDDGDRRVLEVKRADLEFNIAHATEPPYVEMRSSRWGPALVRVLEALRERD